MQQCDSDGGGDFVMGHGATAERLITGCIDYDIEITKSDLDLV